MIGPDLDYYEELVAEIPGQESKAREVLRKLAEAVQRLVPESLTIETLTDAGQTSAQNNSSVISVLNVAGRLSIFTGDAGIPALSRAAGVLEAGGYSPGNCKFVQIPHHGSRRNVGPSILDRLLGEKGVTERRASAFASAAIEGAPKHPAKKVTNAFRRRGYMPHATRGNALRHHHQAPPRPGYSPCAPLPLYAEVEHSDD